MDTMVRIPAVAGHFYPGTPDKLAKEIEGYTRPNGEAVSALGCIVPHAGYMYSGHVAGAVYARLKLPRRFIILCPNHTGKGVPLGIMTAGEWLTPLGNAKVDVELAQALKENYDLLTEDMESQRGEHALEVQLPFLQKLAAGFSFVPVTLGTRRFELLEALGEAIAATLNDIQDEVLIIASSDMNHYEPDEVTRVKDKHALACILNLDPRGLLDVVNEKSISMCGCGPAVAMLTAARRRGARHAKLVKYATSGDISGDRSAVVGYAGVIVE